HCERRRSSFPRLPHGGQRIGRLPALAYEHDQRIGIDQGIGISKLRGDRGFDWPPEKLLEQAFADQSGMICGPARDYVYTPHPSPLPALKPNTGNLPGAITVKTPLQGLRNVLRSLVDPFEHKCL